MLKYDETGKWCLGGECVTNTKATSSSSSTKPGVCCFFIYPVVFILVGSQCLYFSAMVRVEKGAVPFWMYSGKIMFWVMSEKLDIISPSPKNILQCLFLRTAFFRLFCSTLLTSPFPQNFTNPIFRDTFSHISFSGRLVSNCSVFNNPQNIGKPQQAVFYKC